MTPLRHSIIPLMAIEMCTLFEHNKMAGWQVKMFSPSVPNAPNLYSWDEPRWRLLDVSTYSRYLVVGDLRTSERPIHLFDTVTRKIDDLDCPGSNIQDGLFAKFHFCQNERKLIAFLPYERAGTWIMSIVIWQNLSENNHYSSYGELPLDTVITFPFQIFVH